MSSYLVVTFLNSSAMSAVVLVLVTVVVPIALIRLNDWYIRRRAAQRDASVEALEALFALEDLRGIGRPRLRH